MVPPRWGRVAQCRHVTICKQYGLHVAVAGDGDWRAVQSFAPGQLVQGGAGRGEVRECQLLGGNCALYFHWNDVVYPRGELYSVGDYWGGFSSKLACDSAFVHWIVCCTAAGEVGGALNLLLCGVDHVVHICATSKSTLVLGHCPLSHCVDLAYRRGIQLLRAIGDVYQSNAKRSHLWIRRRG